MQFPSQCINRTDRCGSTNYPVPCSAVWANNRNFQNIGATYRHGTVFSPTQCLYCKEATGVENPKVQFLVSAKTKPTVEGQQTTQCLEAQYGQAIEIFKTSGLPIAMVPCLHQSNVYIVRKLRVWRAQ